MPKISETVVFHPRTGEYRAGKNEFAAIVTGAHDDGTCDLVIFYDADDFIGQRNVPQRQNGQGLGWERADVAPQASTGDIEAAFGEIVTLKERVAVLEAKRGPGRPKKGAA